MVLRAHELNSSRDGDRSADLPQQSSYPTPRITRLERGLRAGGPPVETLEAARAKVNSFLTLRMPADLGQGLAVI